MLGYVASSETTAETATSGKFGGACNYAAAAPRPPPHHASGDSATLADGSMAHNIQDTGFDLPSDILPICIAPEYIADMITEYTPGRQLRSAGSRLLRVLERYGWRGLSVMALYY